MIRTHLVKSLYENLLGPINGPTETIKQPYSKYQIGILESCFHSENLESAGEILGIFDETTIPYDSKKIGSAEEVSSSIDNDVQWPDTEIDLAGSFTLGLSFVLTGESPKIQICSTWGRYVLDDQSNRTFGLFHRQPNFYLTEWLDVKNYVEESKPLKLAPKKGNIITKLGVELQIRSRHNPKTNKWNVQVFLVNRTPYRDKKDDGTPKRQTEEDRVFQPQLRIKADGDSIIDYLGNVDEEELLYRNNRTKARGFQCSAVWSEIDPEKTSEQNEFRQFTWIDSQNKLIPKQVIEDFTCPPIRTEYIPVYSIMQPEPSIREYNAEFFSNCWNFEKILKGDSTGSSSKSGLDALLTNYDEWITKQGNKLSDLLLTNLSSAQKITFESQGLRVIENCKKSLKDIRKGVDFIRDDERARLAFCFMNSVMFENRKNNNRNKPLDQQLNWREFQMAFILQSLRGVAGFDKEEQNFADVLWFPTGGGKTEAYLGIIIFASAYRRLLDLDSSEESISYNNDGGVCAISRYTLRLLTIQQFQRALGVFVVSDLKRVQNWIPKEMLDQSLKFELDYLNKKFFSKNMWGKTRFSIGLWIGGNSTPTRFAYMAGMNRGKTILNAEGMLMSSLDLERNFKNYYEIPRGDPAQVTVCPICENTLCLLNDEKLLDKKLTWIIQSNKNLETLQKIPKTDFQNTEVHLKSDPIFHELSKKTDGGYFFRVTMDISLKRKNPENIKKIIDEWWHHAVNPNFIAGDNSSLCSTRASMPGYFFLKQEGGNGRPYDFVIHCTNKECELNNTLWNEQTPSGNSNSIPKPFRTINSNVSLSVPISAYTVDEQIFAKCPTFIIATADKFAKLPWDPRCASLFGNVNSYHADFGYNRDITFSSISDCNVPLLDTKGKRKVPHPSELTECKNFLPPSLIVQDELHLIEGPLGSMVGIYEMAVDVLCRTKNNKPKYIASSATIKESKSQVGTLFRKDIRVFPQPGIFSDDNFFAKIIEDPSCARENSGGRLYLGLCSGKSTYDLPIKAMSIIMSEINKIRQNPELYGESEIDIEKNIDPYWTHVSYFSDLQLMSRFTSFYSDDIQRDVEKFSPPRIGSENISGIITIPKGTYIIPITSNVDFSAWGVSVYCQSTGGNIAVALYADDGHTKKLIWKSDQKRCEEGENIFSNNEKNTTKKIMDEKITNIKKDTTVWVAIFTDSDGIRFDGINSSEPWFEFDSPLTTTKKIHQDPYSILKKEEKYEVNFPDILNTSKSCKIKNPIRVEITGKIRYINRKLPVTLSSETKSEDLPRHLESLQIGLTKNDDGTINDSKTPDALLTSPVFGTGIDVDRLGLMAIMNQPKTTSGYIQASGRVGRKEPGLVIAWLRARRARDLDHYENFLGYHRKIHSFVEPVTANPFSRETLELCLGPILVSILRNAKNVNSIPISSKWVTDPCGSFQILENKHGSSMDLESVKNILIEIGKSDHIPKFRRNPAFKTELISQITKWYNLAKDMKKQNKENLFPYGQTNPNKPASTDVVLGSPFHELRGKEAAFSNTKNSLRETESTAIFYSQLNTTAIRPSQFLTRYGPGSLLPTTGSSIASPSISSMIVDLEKPIGNFNEIVDHKKQLNKIEILDSNMTKMLYQKNGETIPFNDIRIFNMPTNASLNSAEKTVEPTQTIYEAKLFPKWGICSNHKANTKIFAKIVYDPRNRAASVQCPFCKREHGNKYSTKFSSVRFVLACKAGHISDVDWTNEIHSDSTCSHNDNENENRVFTWNESGGGDNIIFRCYGIWRKEVGGQSTEYDLFEKTTCNQETRYLGIKGKSIRGGIECDGKFIESNSGSERCSKPARLVLKSMMSLRSPAIISSLVIEQKKSHMFEKLSKEPLIQTFRNAKFDLDDEKSDWDGNDIAEKFIIQQKRGNIDVGDPLIRDIRNCTREQLDTIYSELTKHRELIQSGEASLSEYENLAGELTSLENVMQRSLEGGSVQQGTLSKSIVYPIQWPSEISELRFEAMPFNDIKVTNVQTGYSREVENLDESDDSIQQLLRNRTGDMVSKFSKHVDKTNDNVWYLGNQNLGEGIFIHLQPKDTSGKPIDAFSMFDKTTFNFKEWNDHNTKISEIVEPLLKRKVGTQSDRDSNESVMMRTNPLFVWWHSFAHQIITELAIDSGFTTTSLSERVYCIKKENGTFSAGILLYVSAPGSDGTLGGLTSLVDDDILPKIVSNAERHLLSCSNDPVCSEREFNPNRNRGAACHSCLMSPETTCSYQNKYLDRNLIRETIEK